MLREVSAYFIGYSYCKRTSGQEPNCDFQSYKIFQMFIMSVNKINANQNPPLSKYFVTTVGEKISFFARNRTMTLPPNNYIVSPSSYCQVYVYRLKKLQYSIEIKDNLTCEQYISIFFEENDSFS